MQRGNGGLRSGRSFTLGEGDRTNVAETPVGGCGDHRRHDPADPDTILLVRMRARLIVFIVDVVAYFTEMRDVPVPTPS